MGLREEERRRGTLHSCPLGTSLFSYIPPFLKKLKQLRISAFRLIHTCSNCIAKRRSHEAMEQRSPAKADVISLMVGMLYTDVL